MALLSKACKPESCILNHATLLILALQIFEAFLQILLIVNLLLNQTLLTLLLYVTQTWMVQLILGGYLPLIQKDSSTPMHRLTVYAKEGLPFAWDLSLKNSADSYLCF